MFFVRLILLPGLSAGGLNYLTLNIKQRCFPFAGLLTVHFRSGKIGRWLFSEVGGGGTHNTEQITHLQPDLQNN